MNNALTVFMSHFPEDETIALALRDSLESCIAPLASGARSRGVSSPGGVNLPTGNTVIDQELSRRVLAATIAAFKQASETDTR